MPKTIQCACGCETLISAIGVRGKPKRYSKGHNHRRPDWKERQKPVLCACGCGAPVVPYDKHGRHVRYIMRHGTRGKTLSSKKPLGERFWKKVQKTDSCWIWTAGKTGAGYGAISDDNKRMVMAHRASWFLCRGRWPESEALDHLCNNRACVNPDHLVETTRGENSRRGVFLNRPVCKCGREFDGSYMLKGAKRRYCKHCSREKDRRRYWSQRI